MRSVGWWRSIKELREAANREVILTRWSLTILTTSSIRKTRRVLPLFRACAVRCTSSQLVRDHPSFTFATFYCLPHELYCESWDCCNGSSRDRECGSLTYSISSVRWCKKHIFALLSSQSSFLQFFKSILYICVSEWISWKIARDFFMFSQPRPKVSSDMIGSNRKHENDVPFAISKKHSSPTRGTTFLWCFKCRLTLTVTFGSDHSYLLSAQKYC